MRGYEDAFRLTSVCLDLSCSSSCASIFFATFVASGPAKAGPHNNGGDYGSAYANTALPALIEMYCLPFTA